MDVKPIVATGNTSAVTPQNTDTGETQPIIQPAVQADNQAAAQTDNQAATPQPAGPAQTAGSQSNAATQAVLVALEGAISSELSELAKMLANRTELVNKLPTEIKEMVKMIFTQVQETQVALPAGLAELLKSPKATTEKLDLLASLLEEAAGLPTKDKQTTVMTAGKQQIPKDLIDIWRNNQPEELKTAVKVLQELVQSASRPTASEPEVQDVPGAAKNGQTAIVPEDVQASQPGQNAGQKGMPAATPQMEAGTNENPTAQAASKQLVEEGGQQEANTSGSVNNKPINQSEAKQAAGQQPPVDGAEGKDQVVAKAAVDKQQQEGSAAKPQNPSESAVRPSSTMVSEQDRTMLLKTMASRPDLVKSLPPEIKEMIQAILRQQPNPKETANLPEPLARFISAQQPASEKLILLATVLTEAASQPRTGRQQGGQQEQALAEIINLLQNKNHEDVKLVARVVRELADTMPKPGGMVAERQDSQSILSFSLPLSFGDGQTVYPAHIHVYHQQEEDKKNPGQHVTETWLRVCLETENIGIVETAFHLYDGETLDVKVRFADQEVADGFAESVEEVKAQLEQLPFTLGEFLVR